MVDVARFCWGRVAEELEDQHVGPVFGVSIKGYQGENLSDPFLVRHV
jgi:hypothetical protein